MQHPTYYQTVVHSPQFQLWVKYNESLDQPMFDTPESLECGWLSQNHFQAFLEFCNRIYFGEKTTALLTALEEHKINHILNSCTNCQCKRHDAALNQAKAIVNNLLTPTT